MFAGATMIVVAFLMHSVWRRSMATRNPADECGEQSCTAVALSGRVGRSIEQLTRGLRLGLRNGDPYPAGELQMRMQTAQPIAQKIDRDAGCFELDTGKLGFKLVRTGANDDHSVRHVSALFHGVLTKA